MCTFSYKTILYEIKKCKFRKINNYIGEKNKRQEEYEKEKESLSTGIQVFQIL